MLHILWNIMGVIGTVSCLGTLLLLTHCYLATKDVYKQMKQLNDKYGKGD